jgi:hypothetical protein
MAHHGCLRRASATDITQRLSVSQDILAMCLKLRAERIAAQGERSCLCCWSQTSRVRRQVGTAVEVEKRGWRAPRGGDEGGHEWLWGLGKDGGDADSR